jgi:hypothetical protein
MYTDTEYNVSQAISQLLHKPAAYNMPYWVYVLLHACLNKRLRLVLLAC